MGFLDNLFNNEKNNKVSSMESIKLFVVNDMEKKWKMHVEQNIPASNKNAVSMLYACASHKI